MQETQGGALIIMLMQPCTVARVATLTIILFLESSSIRVSKKRNSQQVRRSAKALKGGVVALSQRESDETSPWYAFSRTAEPLTRPLQHSRSYSTYAITRVRCQATPSRQTSEVSRRMWGNLSLLQLRSLNSGETAWTPIQAKSRDVPADPKLSMWRAFTAPAYRSQSSCWSDVGSSWKRTDTRGLRAATNVGCPQSPHPRSTRFASG